MNGISPLASLAAPATGSLLGVGNRGSAIGSSGVGGSDFSKILNAQMRSHGATAPGGVSDVELLQALSLGANLIGKTIQYSKDGSGTTARGVVESLRVESGKIQLVVNGASVPLDRVQSLRP